MRGFSITEFEERLTRARLFMQEEKLEMLLITSPHNFRYFTGFDSYFGKVQLAHGFYYYH